MDFALTAEQVALQDSVRSLCVRRFPMTEVRRLGGAGGVDRASWSELIDLGAFATRVPVERDGVGLGVAESVLVLEQLGRHLVPGPLVPTELAAADLSLAAPVVGMVERHDTPVLVECLRALDTLVVLDDDGAWVVDPRHLDARPVARPLDPLAPLHVVTRLPLGEQVGGPELTARLRRHGAVLTAAYLAGSAAAVTDLAVEHARQREQFGRPIGSFQAVKHLLADMVVRAAVAQAAVHAAGVEADEAGDGGPDTGEIERAAHTAKVLAGDAAVRNAKAALQVHGGMGYTWDVDVHLHLKRAWYLNTTFGTPDEHADRLAASGT